MRTSIKDTSFPSAGEWSVLLGLYDLGRSAKAAEVRDRVANPDWSSGAVRTMLANLVKKGWVTRFHPGAGSGRAILFRAAHSETEALRRFAEHVATFYFRGSPDRTAVVGELLLGGVVSDLAPGESHAHTPYKAV